MDNFGFYKVSAAIPTVSVANPQENSKNIISLVKEAFKENSKMVVFPELSITGYTCGDLFQKSSLINESQLALFNIASNTKELPILILVGLPIPNNNKLYNCAAVINRGKILAIIPKSYIPGYREFYEPRWFSTTESPYSPYVILQGQKINFGTNFLFRDKNESGATIGVEICEDLWVPIPPSSYQALAGATILTNLSASNVLVAKSDYRRELVKNQSARCLAGYIYSSSGFGESTTDVVFDGDATIVENGVILKESKRFLHNNQIIHSEIDLERLQLERIRQNSMSGTEKIFEIIEFETKKSIINITRKLSPKPFIPQEKNKLSLRCEEIFNIQASGLARRLQSIPNINATIGISGGLDSTLALLVTIKAFSILKKDLQKINALTMPGFGTSSRTYNNAVSLCKELGVNLTEIDIKDISSLMFDKLNISSSNHNIVYENVQARARTYILMSEANKTNSIVIGTGDLSEIALGWSTYNGDHISMYNVNSSVPKTLVIFLVEWIANNEFNENVRKILLDIIEQPISPELIPPKDDEIIQKTEDKIGPYELHDFFLYYFLRFGFSGEKILFLAKIAFKDKYTKDTIKKWLKTFFTRFFHSQWKRDCVPGGPKIGSIDLSPRGSWRMPSEADIDAFINFID